MRLLPFIGLPALFSVMVLFTHCSKLNDNLLSPLPDTVSYQGNIESIFTRSCVRCHGGAETRKIDLSTYDHILDLAGDDPSEFPIQPGDPNSPILRIRLNPETGSMYQYLSDYQDYQLIYNWIVIDSLAE